MSRKTTSAAQPAAAAPATSATTAAPGTEAKTIIQDATQATITESTLGDGDATGAEVEAPLGSTAPEAPAPDVVNAPDGTPPSDNTPGYGVKGHVVRVVGPAKGRWRAGRHFTPEPVEIAASELKVEDVQKLFDDPELICAVVSEA